MRFHVRRIAKLLFITFVIAFSVIFLATQVNQDAQSNSQELFRVVTQNYTTSRVFIQKDKTFNISKGSKNVHLFRSQRNVHEYQSFSYKLSKQIKYARRTVLDDIFISLKTTAKNHQTRLDVLLETWITAAKNQTFIFTDSDDEDLRKKHGSGRVINTNCPRDHYRKSLVCKMAQEFDWYINSRKPWFCHVDDDTYVNVDRLVDLLQQYNHTDDWYLGKPSLAHPIEVEDRSHPGQKMAFWFATGGAGFCISRALALKMVPYAGGGRLMRAAEQIRLPDDCTIGYIIESLLHKHLTVIEAFHSHLESLWKFSVNELKDQITLSYTMGKNKDNKVNIVGFPEEKDPTRLKSIHCHLYPRSNACLSGNS